MNFLEAHAVLSRFPGGPPLRFSLLCSAVTATLDLYVKATAASFGFEAQLRSIGFDEMALTIRTESATGAIEVIVLLPWDLVPAVNWRTGLPEKSLINDEVEASLREHVELYRKRRNARFVFLPAPSLPVMSTLSASRGLEGQIRAAAAQLGAVCLDRDDFNLLTFLDSGNPFASKSLGRVAQAIVGAALDRPIEPKKVVVTDLDNTLWRGIVGEDGVSGLAHAPEGSGFPFFVYQSMLRKLKNDGVLLAAVSRNDRELALAPFAGRNILLEESDFVAIVASYHAKSAQIQQLANELNLGLNAFVVVDDNPVELAEIRAALPDVECVEATVGSTELPSLLDRLQLLCGKADITDDDRHRTAMYRTRVAGAAPSEARGADLTRYLATLQMKLTIRQHLFGDHSRCLQLINKTNQFNINGRRISESELHEILSHGGRLIGATLDDRNGTHGEVIACLLAPGGMLAAFVMSCRVFQRRVERAFLAWLAASSFAPTAMNYVKTERNEPVRMLLSEAFGHLEEGCPSMDFKPLALLFADDLALFQVTEA